MNKEYEYSDETAPMPACDIARLRNALIKIINYNSVAEPYGDKYQQMVLDIKDIARRALNED